MTVSILHFWPNCVSWNYPGSTENPIPTCANIYRRFHCFGQREFYCSSKGEYSLQDQSKKDDALMSFFISLSGIRKPNPQHNEALLGASSTRDLEPHNTRLLSRSGTWGSGNVQNVAFAASRRIPRWDQCVRHCVVSGQVNCNDSWPLTWLLTFDLSLSRSITRRRKRYEIEDRYEDPPVNRKGNRSRIEERDDEEEEEAASPNTTLRPTAPPATPQPEEPKYADIDDVDAEVDDFVDVMKNQYVAGPDKKTALMPWPYRIVKRRNKDVF